MSYISVKNPTPVVLSLEGRGSRKKRFGWQHGLLSTQLACVITSKEPFILLNIKPEQATVLCPLPLTKWNMTPECCTAGISCFCLPAFVETRAGRIKNDSWHLCNAVWQNLVLCLLFCRGSGPYRFFSNGNLHIKIALIYMCFMNGNMQEYGVFLCLISPGDAVWDFIILLWCTRVFVHTCASWGPFGLHPGWVLPRSERSSWPALCPSFPAPTWSVSESLPLAPMPAASQVQPGTTYIPTNQ